jgi:hypothetical protein
MHPKLCTGSAQKGACGILSDTCDRACMWLCMWFHSRSVERGLAQGARQNTRKGAAARQGPAGVGIWLPRLRVHLQREIVTARRPNHKTTARAASTSVSTVTTSVRVAVRSRARWEQREARGRAACRETRTASSQETSKAQRGAAITWVCSLRHDHQRRAFLGRDSVGRHARALGEPRSRRGVISGAKAGPARDTRREGRPQFVEQTMKQGGEIRRGSGVCHGDSSRISTAQRSACVAHWRAPTYHRKLKGGGKEAGLRGAYSEA